MNIYFYYVCVCITYYLLIRILVEKKCVSWYL